ncbi:uncharacterized protein LOC142317901 [Lycorma delicatula]|uniref:uncharacterized protein LOC142317901 n=1 Tax=Lycorma delicatula TaxID=130591 RepID=UPI003F50F75E
MDAKGVLSSEFQIFLPDTEDYDSKELKDKRKLDKFVSFILPKNSKYVDLWEIVKLHLIFSHATVEGCLDCTTFPQDSRSYIGSEINTNSLLDRNFFSERNHLTTLQGLTHPVASELTGRPLWPIYFQSQVPENNPHNLAKQLLQICSFRLYEAFALFARQMGWGEIACEITPQTQNGNTVYISKIHVKEAPTDVQSALMSLVKPFCAATEDAAREASAYKIWKLILPHLQIPLFSQYIY